MKLLLEAEDYVSGQELCQRFNVSRTAIWKVVNQLKEEGYSIEATRNKGYRMIDSPDVLNKETIESHVGSKEFGCQVVCFDVIDSTNIQAKVLAEQGCPHGMLVVADQQVSGRGRRGRAWESPPGTGISMSLVLRPTFPPKQASMLTLIMASSVRNAIQKYMDELSNAVVMGNGKGQNGDNQFVQIKWPNDIVIGRKKVCGILTEMSTEIDYINYVVIGVGINVSMETFAPAIEDVASSLKLEWTKMHGSKGQKEPYAEDENDISMDSFSMKRAKLIAMILEEFQVLYDEFCQVGDLSFMVDVYNEALVNKDRQVRVLEPQNEYEAVALGINEQGELLVRKQDGEIEQVYAGEVSVRGIYGYAQ